MKKNSNIAKFAIWIVRFCTDNNITTASFTDEQDAMIKTKVYELIKDTDHLSESNQRLFYFDCGVLTSAALLNRDALELMVNEMRY